MARNGTRIVEVTRGYIASDDAPEIDVLVRVEVEGRDTPHYFDKSFGNWLPGDSREARVVEVVEDRDGYPERPDLLAVFEDDESVIDAALEMDGREAEGEYEDAMEARREMREGR